MIGLEIIAMLFGLVCIFLYTKQNIWAWPVGIIGIIGYFTIFLISGLTGQMILQALFFIQSLYGWYIWKFSKQKEDLTPTYLNWKQRILAIIGIGIGTLLFYFLGIGALPFLDGFGASLSIVAVYLLAKKKIETWYLWAISNIVLISICVLSGLYISIGFYSIAMILNIKGIREWKQLI
jgi:nicotinamide mononucleotide transporter